MNDKNPTADDPRQADEPRRFSPEALAKSVVTEPLLSKIKADPDGLHEIIIELNLDYTGGRSAARQRINDWVGAALGAGEFIAPPEGSATHPYVFATLRGSRIFDLAAQNRSQAEERYGQPIYRVWEDSDVAALINVSCATVKADAARIAYGAQGKGIVWAVLDSGIDGNHPHFAEAGNLQLTPPLQHYDFVGGQSAALSGLPADPNGHGTHVAGIIAGVATRRDAGADASARDLYVRTQRQNEGLQGDDSKPAIEWDEGRVEMMCGMAPQCRLVSMRVLDDDGNGKASRLIAAIEEIMRINDYGRRLLIHGVNLSVGYGFDPEWFACGQSPLCVVVNRLVRSGVVVVVAAGNTGYGRNQTRFAGPSAAGLALTINDPGNAELAITVGSTHRDMPHVYGVSYFSSKGPTGDGRLKPDLVAPGERVVSCATGRMLPPPPPGRPGGARVVAEYVDSSGTSMAAPHVSGVVAAFLSIRREYIGQPEAVKQIFTNSATDLNRERNFQGRGLVDLMRAIQSV